MAALWSLYLPETRVAVFGPLMEKTLTRVDELTQERGWDVKKT